MGLAFPLLATAVNPELPDDCESRLLIKSEFPITLPFLSSSAREGIKNARVTQPRRDFFDIDGESRIDRTGIEGPKALQGYLGSNVRFMAVPSANSPTDITVGSPEEGISLPVRVEAQWQDDPAGTLAYVNLPYKVNPSETEFLVGEQYEHVLIHLHGGGTQHARGENSTTLGIALGKRGIPVIGIDLPGHGDGPSGTILTSEQVMDWIVEQILPKLVHANVKVTLSGHSWGAMLAVFLRNNSHNPKYARIVDVISLSPGVDTSLGGDAKTKLEFERWFEDNFHKFKDQIAASDYDFLSNTIENDKLSTLGAYATVASALDYNTPVMSLEQQKDLINMLIITGKADGLVYVGREKFYQLAWGNLKEGSQLILLDPGTTFKSKDANDLIPTGHQLFDLQIPGTTSALVYKLMGDRILGGRASAKPAPEDGVNPKKLTDEEKKMRAIKNVLDDVLRQYAHFFPFRKLVENFVRYKRVPTEHLKAGTMRKRSLDEYVNKVTSTQSRMTAERNKILQKKTEELRASIGITERLDLNRAQEELNYVELTAERKATLENFIANAAAVEADLKARGDDEQYKTEAAQLWATHKDFLESKGIHELSGYLTLHSSFQGKKKGDAKSEEEKTRTQLATIDREYKRLDSEKATRFGQERSRLTAAIDPNSGLTDPKAAARELAADRSPERREKILKYIFEYPKVVAQADAAFENMLQNEIDKIAKPEGVTSIEDARLLARNEEELLNLMYAIPDQPEIQNVVGKIHNAMVEKDLIQKGSSTQLRIDDLEKELHALKVERERIVKQWEALWKENPPTSEKIEKLRADYKAQLDVLIDAHHKMAHAIDDYLQQEFVSGNKLTRTTIEKRPQSLRDLEKAFRTERLKFLDRKNKLQVVITEEALAGHLIGEKALEAKKLASELSLKPFSLTSRIHELEKTVEFLRERESILTQKKERLHWQYAQLLKQKGINTPYDVEKIEAYNLLDQPLEQLIEKMKTDQALIDTLQDLLNVWKPLAKKLRVETQLSD